MRRWIPVTVVLVVAGLLPAAASGQDQPRLAVDASAGYARFVDDDPVDHLTLGGAVRFHVTPRFSVGPEVTYMDGPNGDRLLFVTAKILYEFRPASRVSPYVVADGGFFRKREGLTRFSFTEGAASGGAGVRIALTPGMFAAGEVRLGWEAHLRFTGLLGWKL